MSSKKGAIVLLSGGLDSTTVLYKSIADGFTPVSLSFHYGQRHEYELIAAARICKSVGCRHVILRLDPVLFQHTSLVGQEMAVPKQRDTDEATIPNTYVPARNLLFLAHAVALAESSQIRDIYIGVNALDYSGYPDCRPEFIESFVRTANLGTKAGVSGQSVEIHAPLLRLGKADIIRLGLSLGVDYADTSSCYDPAADGRPCGQCDSCQLRRKGFAEAKLLDPLNPP